MELRHVDDCLCRYVPATGGVDVKTIDTRCIVAFHVPEYDR